MPPLVSVVITTRNRRELLPEAVASVQAQSFTDLELIVVDDASSDGTWPWLAGQRGLRAIRLSVHGGYAVPRNRGVAEATGDLVMFLDDDDRLRRGALDVLSSALREHPDAVAAVGALQRFGAGVVAARVNHPLRARTRVVWPELLAGWSVISGQGLLRAACVKAIAGYRPEHAPGEDRDLWLRVARLGPVRLVPDVVLEYRVHPGQWRPPDIVERRERVFEAFVGSLCESERPRARRVRRAGRAWGQAELAREARRHPEAARAFVRALVACPPLWRSPLLWPPLLRGLLESLTGGGARG